MTLNHATQQVFCIADHYTVCDFYFMVHLIHFIYSLPLRRQFALYACYRFHAGNKAFKLALLFFKHMQNRKGNWEGLNLKFARMLEITKPDSSPLSWPPYHEPFISNNDLNCTLRESLHRMKQRCHMAVSWSAQRSPYCCILDQLQLSNAIQG